MRFLLLICTCAVFFFLPHNVYAEVLPADLSQWQVMENSQFDDNSVPCLERDGPSTWQEQDDGLGITIDTSLPCQTVITPKNKQFFGLRRFSLVFSMHIDDAAHDHNILVNWKDRNNFSNFHLLGQNIEYEKIIAGQPVYSVSTRLALGPQSTNLYRMEHDESTGITRLWRDGRPLFTIIEPEATPELPPAWIGLRAAVGEQRTSHSLFSNIQVNDLGLTHSTTTPLLKQNDPQWGHLEYDHASVWSTEKPTIARWGCALTSAIMVMQSYGITQLPSGAALLPGNVNEWLLTQPDGYFGEGHLNWRALTRLALESHAAFGSTKLEFTYERPTNKLPWLTETLALGKPIILDMDGHFVVTHEAGKGENDFSIHDPLFPITKLKEYHNTYVSARLFTPSQTDLSAITVIAPLEASVQFLHSDGSDLPATKFLLPPLEKNGHTSQQLYDLAKPPHENITIEVKTTSSNTLPLTIFSYSQLGAVIKKEVSVNIASPSGSKVLLEWSDEKQSQVPQIAQPAPTSNLYLLSRSPFYSMWFDQWKLELSRISNLESAQAWMNGIDWILDTSWKNSWLSFSEHQTLQNALYTNIREKFP